MKLYEDGGYCVSWLQIQNILITHFQNSTIEFLWEENTPISASTLVRCMKLQCILLLFNSLWLQRKTHNLPFDDKHDLLQKFCWINLRRSNAIALIPQKYSPHNLLLFSDSTFPSKVGRNRELQTSIFKFQIYNSSTPIFIPNAIVFNSPYPIDQTKYIEEALFVEPAVTSAILIFANSQENVVKIGSLANGISNYQYDKERHFWMVKISFQNILRYAASSYTDLVSFWENIHSNFHFGPKVSNENTCISLASYKNPLAFYDDQSCETFRTYITWSNCTDFKTCYHFYSKRLKLINLRDWYNLRQFFPFGHNLINLGFQVLFPKVNLFDANLTAFLSPLTMNVWLCTLLSIISISIWLIWLEGGLLRKILYWQFTVLFEQDEGYRFRKGGFWAKIIVIGWILSSILLRNFYNSSLYSMIAAEREPNNYPHSLQELLGHKDFQFLVHDEACFDIWFLLTDFQAAESSGYELNLPLQVAKLYASITLKASCMFPNENVETLQNVSIGNYARTYYYNYTGSEKSKLLDTDFVFLILNSWKEKLANLGLFACRIVKAIGIYLC
ncbi:unnamed protein product [Orchesella dallaii]|uniref:C-type lectin domain-containing protein n=1 Tax=Orchesella dallaii TaxID=48710 RepID=A0ABP1RGR1_9HEXA